MNPSFKQVMRDFVNQPWNANQEFAVRETFRKHFDLEVELSWNAQTHTLNIHDFWKCPDQ